MRIFHEFSARFLLLAALCVLLPGVSAVYFVRFLLAPGTGLVVGYPEVTVEAGAVVFSPRAPFSAAVAAGLLPGRDRILSVGGTPVASSRDVLAAVSRIKGYEPFPVEVLRDGGTRLTIVVTPTFALVRADWIFVLVFCVALGYAAFSLFWRQPREPATLPIVLAALFYLVFTCVKPFYYESLLSNCLIHLGKVTSWLLVFFGLYFPRKRGTRASRAAFIGFILAIYAVFVAARIVLYTRWMRSGAEQWLDLYRLLGQAGNIADGIAYLVLGALLATAYIGAKLQRERKQLQWIIAGVLIALPPYYFFDQLPLILRGTGVRVGLGSFAELFLSFIPVLLLVGLTRHRVFSLRFFLTRYAVTLALVILMAVLFAAAYLPLRDWISSGYRLPSPAADLLAAGALFVFTAALQPAAGWLLGKTVLRAPRPGDLERKNAELMLIVEELEHRSATSLQARRLAELRAILRGIVRRLEGPIRRMNAGLAGHDAASALEAGIEASEFLRGLQSLVGPETAVPADVPAESLVRSAISRTCRRFPAARISIVALSSARISCFSEEVTQAFSYLLDNAVEAGPSADSPVGVRIASEEDRVVLEVTDQGPGIVDAERRRLFTPFTSRKPGHAGLGLYTARMIAERNDGMIVLERGESCGTRARLVFPRTDGP